MLPYRIFSVSYLKCELDFISQHLKPHVEHRIQANRLRQASDSLSTALHPKELGSIAKEIDIFIGGGHSHIGQVYMTHQDGRIDHETTDLYHQYLDDVTRFAKLGRRPWLRWMIRLVE